MKIAFFDAHRFDREAFTLANEQFKYTITYFEARLCEQTARLAQGFDVVCSFVNDTLDRQTIQILQNAGVRLVALRCAGYNHVDLAAAKESQLPVVRVPEYSPHAVAEHAVSLILSLNRKIHHAYIRVRELNFSLEGLVGFDLYGKSVGIIGTGRIGKAMATIMSGFGCRVLLHDVVPDHDFSGRTGCQYVELQTLYAQSDIISLHLPLTPKTRHMIDDKALTSMKRGVMLINTGRGALIDTKALIQGLKSGHVKAAGLDVYEEEEGVFFHDLSDQVLNDDVLARLLTFPNVLMTSHQGFLTHEALHNIAQVTLENIREFESAKKLKNVVN